MNGNKNDDYDDDHENYGHDCDCNGEYDDHNAANDNSFKNLH